MNPERISATSLAHALQEVAPSPNNALLFEIADILARVAGGLLSPDQARKTLTSNSAYSELIDQLKGKKIETSETLVSFGTDGQTGDISVRDVVGGNSVHINYYINTLSSTEKREPIFETKHKILPTNETTSFTPTQDSTRIHAHNMLFSEAELEIRDFSISKANIKSIFIEILHKCRYQIIAITVIGAIILLISSIAITNNVLEWLRLAFFITLIISIAILSSSFTQVCNVLIFQNLKISPSKSMSGAFLGALFGAFFPIFRESYNNFGAWLLFTTAFSIIFSTISVSLPRISLNANQLINLMMSTGISTKNSQGLSPWWHLAALRAQENFRRERKVFNWIYANTQTKPLTSDNNKRIREFLIIIKDQNGIEEAIYYAVIDLQGKIITLKKQGISMDYLVDVE